MELLHLVFTPVDMLLMVIVHAGIGVDEPVLPSLGKPGQRIRLPGQTRVMPDEYKEFLALGHGDIFNLDPDLYAPSTYPNFHLPPLNPQT